MERVSQLETSSQQWKGRVSQSDATRFTVAHKMASASSVPSLVVSSATSTSSSVEETTTVVQKIVKGGSAASSTMTSSSASSTMTSLGAESPPPGSLLSPASERRGKRSPQPKVFKSKTGSSIPELLNNAVTSRKGGGAKEFSRSISIPAAEVAPEEAEAPTVSIPRPDDASFQAFFASSSTSSSSTTLRNTSTRSEEAVMEIKDEDFEHIASNTSQLCVKRRSVRARRKQPSSGNPLRSLALRGDLIRDEYTQVDLGAGQRELTRIKVEELSKSSSLAMEALAGLASRENFSAVALKKVEENPVIRELAPYSDLALIQVKGRRHPQVRLVNPSWKSINQGDDFLLITPHELFHYKGRFSNVIERAVASDMSLYILQTKDMGVTSALKVTDVEETSPTAKKERFWGKIGGSSESEGAPPGPPEGDDSIEAALIASNKVFEVRGQDLVPLEEAWGQSPKYDLLSSEKVLVLDFGSELYVWSGKRCPAEAKRRGTRLAKELWREEADYTDCDLNPICPPVDPGVLEGPMKVPRPSWGICGKITENVETILFKEKFLDWPDTAQQTRIKEVRIESEQKCEPVCDLEPCDVDCMLSSLPVEPDLVLEMSHLGRGVVYYDEEERRLHTISTNDFKVWQISESEKKALDARSARHFFSGETYVVRWYYHVTATGRTLKGAPSRHNVTGRSRVAYFFWQGRTSSVSDKGLCALMTVELDEERGPHVRVDMGAEPPAFLNLFGGGLVVHEGKRDLNNSPKGEKREDKRGDEREGKRGAARLFVVRGEVANEGHLIECDVTARHLRSRACVVVVDLEKGIVFLWKGAKVLKHYKEVGLTASKLLASEPADEMGWQVRPSSLQMREEREGAESKEFLSLLEPVTSSKTSSTSWRTYYSLVAKTVSSHPCDWTTRVWKLEAQSDQFTALEMSSSYRATDRESAFPVLQEEVYGAAGQPALYLIDAGLKVYVWQGWFPQGGPEEDSATTGSALLRFTFARRAALQTAVLYVRKKDELIKNGAYKNGSFSITDCASILSPKLVVSGMESLEFKNLFPVWKDHEEVTRIQEKEGRWKTGREYCVREMLDQLCRERYSLSELQAVPLPDGVDPSRLERYLSEGEFEGTLGVTRREFISLPAWRQRELKKKGNLF